MFLQQVINGIMLGSTYSLVAIGYSLVFGVIKIVNISNGSFYMLGSFIALVFFLAFSGHFLLAIILAIIINGILGLCMDKFALRRLRTTNAPPMASIISTMGVSIILENVVLVFISNKTEPFPNVINFGNLHIGKAVIGSTQIIIFLTALVLMVAVSLIVNITKMGRAMRSISQNVTAAYLMGVNVNQVISTTFIMSAALAAVSGILVGMYYQAIDVNMSLSVGMKTFAAAVLGGVGVLPGAMIGGLIIGVAESIGASYISSGYRDAIAFAIMIIVLIVRPTGILEKKDLEKI